MGQTIRLPATQAYVPALPSVKLEPEKNCVTAHIPQCLTCLLFVLEYTVLGTFQ